MRAQTLPASAGWRWIAGGFAIFKRNPPILSMLVVAYWMTVLVLNVLPFVGTLLASMAIPGLSVGLMQASRNLERGELAGIHTLLGGLRQNTRTLIGLGALYLCCTLGAFALTALFDGGDFLGFMLSGKPGDAPEDDQLLTSMLIMMTLMTPVLMAYWFAPVLAAWHQLSLAKALFFSFVACWMNWRAFLAYGVGLVVIAGILPSVILALLLVIFPGLASLGTALVLLPMLLIFVPTIFASFYVSYRDIFGISALA